MAESAGMAYLDGLSLEEKKYFLHIGTFDVRKNIPVLVRAFHEFLDKTGLDFKLVLAGGKGQSSQMNDWPHVQRLVQELGLIEKVLLPGYVSDSEVRALYEGAFCYCFPSENEGFGIPVVEAMSLGVPVIHSDQPALIEVSGGAGLVSKTGDSADLAEKMILLSSNKSLQSDLIAQGKQRAADFTAEKLIQDFHQVILSLQD
jgi:glycosyltransferase involved in cell wall biosynthesis